MKLFNLDLDSLVRENIILSNFQHDFRRGTANTNLTITVQKIISMVDFLLPDIYSTEHHLNSLTP